MGPQTEYANFQEMYEKFLGGSSWYSVENKGGKSLGNHYGQNFVILLKNYDLLTPMIKDIFWMKIVKASDLINVLSFSIFFFMKKNEKISHIFLTKLRNSANVI